MGISSAIWWLLVALIGAALSWRIQVYYLSQTAAGTNDPEEHMRNARIAGSLATGFFIILIGAMATTVYQTRLNPNLAPMSAPNAGTQTEMTAPVAGEDSQPATEGGAEPAPSGSSIFSEPSQLASPTPVSDRTEAVIANTDGLGVNVRDAPSLSGGIVTQLNEGTRVILLDEIREGDGLSWQAIEIQDGRQGWVASQFLIPQP